jgi:hypothetical protein
LKAYQLTTCLDCRHSPARPPTLVARAQCLQQRARISRFAHAVQGGEERENHTCHHTDNIECKHGGVIPERLLRDPSQRLEHCEDGVQTPLTVSSHSMMVDGVLSEHQTERAIALRDNAPCQRAPRSHTAGATGAEPPIRLPASSSSAPRSRFRGRLAAPQGAAALPAQYARAGAQPARAQEAARRRWRWPAVRGRRGVRPLSPDELKICGAPPKRLHVECVQPSFDSPLSVQFARLKTKKTLQMTV